jgi:type IV secretory pathway VirB2 component (pilin)
MVMMLASILSTLPEWALAQTSTGPPMDDVFCTACKWLIGPVGQAIAMICVAISGLGAMLGKLTWGVAMLVGANVATLFGAALVVDALAGGAAITQCDASILNQVTGGNNDNVTCWGAINSGTPPLVPFR